MCYLFHSDSINTFSFRLGMFMVCADFMGAEKNLVAQSCRSTMLHYRGTLIDVIYKLVFSPFFIFGRTEEKQLLHVELFSDYEEAGVISLKSIIPKLICVSYRMELLQMFMFKFNQDT